jgi:hypothetical protein
MMQEITIPSTETQLGFFLIASNQTEKLREKDELEVILASEAVDNQVVGLHPNTWQKYCDGRLRQFRASR